MRKRIDFREPLSLRIPERYSRHCNHDNRFILRI